MQFNKTLLAVTLLTAGGFATISNANAAEPNPATSSFGVQTTVQSICTVKEAPAAITFDSVQAGQATTNMQKVTNLTLNCSKGDVATISLKSRSSGTTDGFGYMLGGVDTLEQVSYKLTSDANGSNPWGAAEGNTVATEIATDYATDITTSIYLTMNNTADVTPGTYTDTIDVSVAY
ncbi:spore coat protein U domain-containing protein [Psychrobacter proteolyticus]|uniref:spore coat protein U domain-containing protein n=1 Tax=Psychrobacter proteolyticus TaxID=147825 RepID=UPI003D0624AB